MTTTYSAAADWCWATRWAECKDRDKSRARALACFPGSYPTRAVFTSAEAYRLRDQLKRGRGLSPATVNRHLAAYLAVWGSAAQEDRGLDPPPSGLYLREPAGRSRVVTDVELGRMLLELPAEYANLAMFLSGTACRVSEALKVRWADIRDNTVAFRDTKNGDDRAVPLPHRARKAFAPPYTSSEWHQKSSIGRDGPYLHLSQAAFNHAWTEAKRKIGLGHDAGFVPHALRHTAR